jgi:hypothetical protein
MSPPDAPWRTRVEVHAAGDGWLAATDPKTGERHEIRTEDAPYAWYAAVWGRDGA